MSSLTPMLLVLLDFPFLESSMWAKGISIDSEEKDLQ